MAGASSLRLLILVRPSNHLTSSCFPRGFPQGQQQASCPLAAPPSPHCRPPPSQSPTAATTNSPLLAHTTYVSQPRVRLLASAKRSSMRALSLVHVALVLCARLVRPSSGFGALRLSLKSPTSLARVCRADAAAFRTLTLLWPASRAVAS